MDIVDGEGVDTDIVEGVGVDGVQPGNDGGVDRTVDQEILRNLSPEKSNSVIIMFFFRREEFVIVPTQEYGDLTGVRGNGGSSIWSPLARSRK